MACCATQIYQTAFGQQNNAFTIRENNMIYLWFDLFPLILFQAGNIDLIIKVTDITNDSLIFHLDHMIVFYHTKITGCGDKDIYLITNFIHTHHTIAFHGCLQRTYRINFCHPYGCTQTTKRLCTALTNITITQNQNNLACNHDICGTLDTIDQRFTATI